MVSALTNIVSVAWKLICYAAFVTCEVLLWIAIIEQDDQDVSEEILEKLSDLVDRNREHFEAGGGGGGVGTLGAGLSAKGSLLALGKAYSGGGGGGGGSSSKWGHDGGDGRPGRQQQQQQQWEARQHGAEQQQQHGPRGGGGDGRPACEGASGGMHMASQGGAIVPAPRQQGQGGQQLRHQGSFSFPPARRTGSKLNVVKSAKQALMTQVTMMRQGGSLGAALGLGGFGGGGGGGGDGGGGASGSRAPGSLTGGELTDDGGLSDALPLSHMSAGSSDDGGGGPSSLAAAEEELSFSVGGREEAAAAAAAETTAAAAAAHGGMMRRRWGRRGDSSDAGIDVPAPASCLSNMDADDALATTGGSGGACTPPRIHSDSDVAGGRASSSRQQFARAQLGAFSGRPLRGNADGVDNTTTTNPTAAAAQRHGSSGARANQHYTESGDCGGRRSSGGVLYSVYRHTLRPLAKRVSGSDARERRRQRKQRGGRFRQYYGFWDQSIRGAGFLTAFWTVQMTEFMVRKWILYLSCSGFLFSVLVLPHVL